MPSGYITISNSVSGLDLRARWWTVDEQSSNNRSQVRVQMQGRKTDGFTTYGTYEGDVYVGGEWRGVASTSESIGSSWTDLGGTSSAWITHNADGSKTTLVGARGRIPGTTFGSTQSGTGNATLTDFDRRPGAVYGRSITDITATTATINWAAPTANGTIQEYHYRVRTPPNSGGTILAEGYVNASTRSVDLENLPPGTEMGFIAQARNQDGWGDWSATYAEFSTLPGGRRKVAGEWRDIVRWRKVAGVWRRTRRWKKVAGEWRPTR